MLMGDRQGVSAAISLIGGGIVENRPYFPPFYIYRCFQLPLERLSKDFWCWKRKMLR